MNNPDVQHIVPNWDSKEHVLTEGCWCFPRLVVNQNEVTCCVHNAQDCRERYERQGVAVSGHDWSVWVKE